MAKVNTKIDWLTVHKNRHMKRKLKPPKVNRAVKYGMVFFNGLFWILSLLLMTAALYSVMSSDTASVRLTSLLSVLLNISVLLLLVGIVMFVVSLTGILGCLRENLPLLDFYRWCIIGFIFLELILTTICFSFPGYVVSMAGRDLPRYSVAVYRDDINMENLLDFIQQRFHCCGVSEHGYLDWSVNPYFNCSEANPSPDRCGVPWSCCVHVKDLPITNYACSRGVQRLSALAADKDIHTDGCIQALTLWVCEHAYVVGASCVAVLIAQGAVMYQASRICVLLERMAPPPPRDRPRRWTREWVVMWARRLACRGDKKEEEDDDEDDDDDE